MKENSYVFNETSVLVILIPIVFRKSGNFLMSMKQSVSLAYLITTYTQRYFRHTQTLSVEHRLRVFENRVLRIFGSKRDEMTGGWRKLHNEELRSLYSSPSIIRMIKSRRMRWVGHVARMGERRNACRILVGKPEGKRPLGRSRRRWVDNIKMVHRKIGWLRIGTSGGLF
jgi:hypothetical protein